MKEGKKVSVRFVLPFLPLLALLFIGLKLGGVGVVATWSWLWVLSPLWIGIALVISFWLGLIGLALLAGAITVIYRKIKGKK